VNLIEAVDKERTKRQMSDRKFSKQVLGISPSYWCLLKAGKRTPSLSLLTLLMHKLPETTPEVSNFVVSQGNNSNQKEE